MAQVQNANGVRRQRRSSPWPKRGRHWSFERDEKGRGGGERDTRYKEERERSPRWRDPSEKRSRLQSSSDDAIACSCIRRHLIALALSCQIHYISLSSDLFLELADSSSSVFPRSTRSNFRLEQRRVGHFEMPHGGFLSGGQTNKFCFLYSISGTDDVVKITWKSRGLPMKRIAERLRNGWR